MYFPIGWPKVLNIPHLNNCSIREIVCNRDKVFFAILSDDTLSIYFCKPCLPIVVHRRSQESVEDIGTNELVQWKPDSSMLVVATSGGYLVYYRLNVDTSQKGVYQQVDSPQPNLRRDSAELFVKEVIPALYLNLIQEVAVGGGVLGMVCIRDELMISTTRGHILRYRWDASQNRDYSLDLRRIPFCINQQVAKAVPIVEQNTYIIDIEYSPLIGGFAVVFNDGRAAFITATTLKFDPNQVQGIWAQNIDDATCATVNHKFRLITYGRKNSQGIVYCIDETNGGLEVSHQLLLSSQVYPGEVGSVTCLKWTPDGCALAMAWERGGFSLWSTFGALLACSLAWDYGLSVDLSKHNPLNIRAMEWSSEGYQLWMVKRHDPGGNDNANGECEVEDSVIQWGFVKSALTVNPCMSHQAHLYLQGEDRLYVNLGSGLTKVYQMRSDVTNEQEPLPHMTVTSTLIENKQWLVILLPSTYSSTNWPIRYTAIDNDGSHIAVAGRTGLAHYSLATKRWKLFGNETQEKDMVVTGGLLWWRGYIIAGCYSIPDDQDQIRLYPRDARLSNAHMTVAQASSQILLLDSLRDRLLIFCADGQITIFSLLQIDNSNSGSNISLRCVQSIDISALLIHHLCVVCITLTALRTEPTRRDPTSKDSFVINVSGRLLMVHQNNNQSQVLAPPTVLASCVENVWVPNKFCKPKPHLTGALWLFCGAHGMRVWLPLFPKDGDKSHTFMSKRIMLPFHLKIYPLAILFEEAILLGAESDSMLYTSDPTSPFSLPFCTLERTSQVYLHQILRQLIRRNLGFHAWEIARCCTGLPYFSHSLELLLHEVLEEEATSKEPIPDAQLPSVVEFIQEFPVYLQTVVQCARKTEIALWPYLFSAAGKPKELFQDCLATKQLETAASYLIILQNLESSAVSRQYATMLLDSTLENCKWELSKDLVRFLRAIDPNDVESPRASFIIPSKYGMPQTPPVNPNEEDLSLVLGTMQVSRGRSFSTTINPKLQVTDAVTGTIPHPSEAVTLRRKKSVPTKVENREASAGSAEEFFMDVMIQRHARRLLCEHRLCDLGRLSAHLDFPLVGWLARERERAARVDNFVTALKHLHTGFNWPYPNLILPSPVLVQRKTSATSGSSVRSSPTIEERMRGLGVDVAPSGSRVGDSGYMSQDPVLRPDTTLLPHLNRGSGIGGYEPVLKIPSGQRRWVPVWLCGEGIYREVQQSHACTTTVIGFRYDQSLVSEDESWFCGDDSEHCASDSWSDIPNSQLLEQFSQDITNRGPHKVEVQLRYLLQLFTEACCLEWSVIISVMLRDVMAVLRATNAARSSEQSYDAVLRLKEGLVALNQWSNTECLGYKPFMLAVQNQVTVLSKLLNGKQRATTPPPANTSYVPRMRTTSSNTSVTAPRSRTTSANNETQSLGVGSVPASDTLTEPVTLDEEDSSDMMSHCSSPTPSQSSSQLTEQSSCIVS